MMRVYKYTLEFMEEIYFSSQEVDRLFMTKPYIGNYALAYAFGWCRSLYNQTKINYKNDFEKLNNDGLYISPANVNTPRYSFFTFNGLPDTYHHMMERAKFNYPQMGRIKCLSAGNKAEGLIFSKHSINKISYIRIGKFMGKAKVTYEDCSYKEIESDKVCYGLINSADILNNFKILDFTMVNMFPVPLYKNISGIGRMYEIGTSDGNIYYPSSVRLGGVK